MSNQELVAKETGGQVAAQQEQQTSPMRLVELAVTQGADVDKLERLMAMQERWESREAEKAFNRAIASFQHECPRIEKRKKGHNYMYAPLGDIIEQIKDTLHKHGLSFTYTNDHSDNEIKVTCTVTHVDGHSKSTSMTVNPDTSGSKNAIQAIGSAQTYGQRYTLIGALGITTADEDIDGRLPDQYKKKPPYKSFQDDKEAITNAIVGGRSAESVIAGLEENWEITERVKQAIIKIEKETKATNND